MKEDTVISLSSDSSASDDDESDVSFTLNHKKKGKTYKVFITGASFSTTLTILYIKLICLEIFQEA